MNRKTLIIIAAILVLGASASLLWSAQNNDSDTSSSSGSSDELTVVTTLFPHYDFARTVAPDANVEFLLPAGSEPHSYEPTPQDIETIQNADLFIYSGEVMEPWVEPIISSLSADQILDLSTTVELIESDHSHDHDHDHSDEKHDDEHSHDMDDHDSHSHDEHGNDDHTHDEHGDHDHDSESTDEGHDHKGEGHDHDKGMKDDDHSGHDHEHGEYDPHFWLNFMNTQSMVTAIADELAEIDSENSEVYRENADELNEELANLDARYESVIGTCEQNTLIIAGHSAFGYLTEEYDLEQVAAQGFSPNSEASPQRIAELIEIIEEEDARAVFSEELLSERLAETLADETDVEIITITPAGNVTRDDLDTNRSFVDIMESNLEGIAKGLSCNI